MCIALIHGHPVLCNLIFITKFITRTRIYRTFNNMMTAITMRLLIIVSKLKYLSWKSNTTLFSFLIRNELGDTSNIALYFLIIIYAFCMKEFDINHIKIAAIFYLRE